MLPNFKTIFLRLLIWTPVIVCQYYIRKFNNYNNEDLNAFHIICFVFFNICVLGSALSNQKRQNLEQAWLNYTKLFVFYLSILLLLFCLLLFVAPWLPPSFFRERVDIRRQQCALQFKELKCDSTYTPTNERLCYRLASCIAQPSNANVITILVFFLLHFVFFSSAEWVFYLTLASSFVFVENLLKLDTGSELPEFGKQDTTLPNEDPDELFFPERAEE